MAAQVAIARANAAPMHNFHRHSIIILLDKQ